MTDNIQERIEAREMAEEAAIGLIDLSNRARQVARESGGMQDILTTTALSSILQLLIVISHSLWIISEVLVNGEVRIIKKDK